MRDQYRRTMPSRSLTDGARRHSAFATDDCRISPLFRISPKAQTEAQVHWCVRAALVRARAMKSPYSLALLIIHSATHSQERWE